ncbi:MAG: aminoacyl-histidine dipeptidase [Lentisphaerae bacterium]|nr:aminoacyl-histidine dipeptidase [Lentisphaerota bacterium]
MSEISKLTPQSVWEIFDLICSIPHISKHEAAVAAALAEKAADAGLKVIQDETGNLIIHRPASSGMENAEPVIMQAHMDMVPASEGEFDFINTPITPYIDGEWVKARGTTLGSDDGIGVALALSVIMDKEFRCGALTVILTVDEEAGMSGAAALAPEYLQGKYLVNLDGSDNGFCIGCAGGARLETVFTPEYDTSVSGHAVKVTLSGLPGGHSGLCIHENRGNALKFLAEFLDQQNGLRLNSFTGGTADNAIPYFAAAEGIAAVSAGELQQLADAYTMLIKADCSNAKDMVIKVESIAAPEKVWTAKFTKELLSAMILVPNEVMDFADTLNIVKTSSNLATVRTLADKVVIRSTQRSLADSDREAITNAIIAHFELFHGVSTMGDTYPATPPKTDSLLLKTAQKCADKLGKRSVAYAIHAGLESGWFSMKNPDLEIISCGPDHDNYHTPNEQLRIKSVGEADRFLRDLLLELAK